MSKISHFQNHKPLESEEHDTTDDANNLEETMEPCEKTKSEGIDEKTHILKDCFSGLEQTTKRESMGYSHKIWKKAPMPTGGPSGHKVLENLGPDWTCYFYCMVCSFNGTSKIILEEHMKIHLGEIQKEA